MSKLKYLSPLLLHNRLTELTYFTTSRCTLQCQHCFIIERLNVEQDELTVDELKRMGRFLGPMQRVHIGGGEPFLRKDIKDILTTISDDWDTGVICVPTNASAKGRVVEAIQHFGERPGHTLRVHLSMNASGDDFAEFCGAALPFEAWLKNAKAIGDATQPFDGITLVALTTVGAHPPENLDALLSFAVDEVGVDDISVGLVRDHGDVTASPDVDDFRSLVDQHMTRRPKAGLVLGAFRDLIRESMADYYDAPGYRIPCQAGRLRVVMAPEGSIYPCEKLGYPEADDLSEWRIGNVRDYDYDLPAMLESPKAMEIRERIRAGRCHCQHGIDMSLSLMASHRFKARLVGRCLSDLGHRLVSS